MTRSASVLAGNTSGIDFSAANMAFSRTFARKGELGELRLGLVSQYARERKDSIQRTIAAMTLGKDVSALFPDVLKNVATPDLEQKKLVYLYLV